MLSAHSEGRDYALLVAAQRLLHPDLLARHFPAGILVDSQDLPSSEVEEEQSWLLDETLETASVLKLEDDISGRWQMRDQSAFLEGGYRWLPCSVKVADQLHESEPGEDRERINASISAFTQRRIAKRLDTTLTLPPLSDTTSALLELRGQRFANVPQLVSIIEKDAALAARIVGWANSAYYAAPGSVLNIHDAIVRVVGFDGVLNLALGVGVGNSVPATPAAIDGAPDYWMESLLTAATMENLANRLDDPECPPGTAYLCGLLSHFGTLLLAHVFAPQFAKIRALQNANRHLYYGFCDMEVLILGRDALAAELLHDWALPPEVVQAVRCQAAPASDHALTRLLNYTRCLLAAEGLGSFPWRLGDGTPKRIAGLEEEDVDEVLTVLRHSADDMQGLGSLLSVAANDGAPVG